jgi:hypothetical protein
MNSNDEPQLLDLEALTRELLFTPPVVHSENALHHFPPRSEAESQRAAAAAQVLTPKRTRKRIRKTSAAKAQVMTSVRGSKMLLTTPSEVPKMMLTSKTSVEVTELLASLTEAFDIVVAGMVLSKESTVKERLIFSMKRRLIMSAAERYIQSSVCASIEDVADEVLSEAYRLQCLIK